LSPVTVFAEDSHHLETRRENIVGGTPAAPSQFPFLCLLKVGNSLCGGTIINNGDYILTAAHCFDNYIGFISSISCQGGTTDVSSASNGQTRYAQSVMIYPSYSTLDPDARYDVALVHLSSPFSPPLAAPIQFATSLPSPGTYVYTAGWGETTSGGPISNNLLWVQVPYVDFNVCQSFWSNILTLNLQICAGGVLGMDSCQGDSGGPLFTSVNPNNASTAALIGITSFGRSCGTTTPSVYTDVPDFAGAWAQALIAAAASSPSTPSSSISRLPLAPTPSRSPAAPSPSSSRSRISLLAGNLCQKACKKAFKQCKQNIGTKCRASKKKCIQSC